VTVADSFRHLPRAAPREPVRLTIIIHHRRSENRRIAMTSAKHDPLMAALIAKLPVQAGQWRRAERIAWLRMMAMAFDVVYGSSGGVRIAPDGGEAGVGDEAYEVASIVREAQGEAEPPETAPQRFYVDPDGFAMGAFRNGAGGRPIAMDDLPAGATLWDERTGIECGDVAAILWRDIGTTRRSLPLGVTLKPAFEAA
jgi:hypothetical protein